MTIQEVSDRSQWDSFLSSVNPNTFLQSWEWGQVQAAGGESIRRLGFFRDGKQIGAALVIIVNAKRGRHMFCPHGPIFSNERDARDHLPNFVRQVKKYAVQDKAVAVRIAPLLVVNQQNVQTFRKLGFRPAPLHVHAERTWNLDLAQSEEKLQSNMRKTTRHAIRKAQQAGVTIDVTCARETPGAISRFWPLYQATKNRHLFTPFSRDFLEQQVKFFSQNNRCYFAFARHKNQDVAAAILIHYGNTVFYHHGASQKLSAKIPASQLLQWEAIQEAKRRGATRYNFWGIAPKKAPSNHPFTGITIFKQGFGGYDIDYLHTQDLPLSLWYWKLWTVETWRKNRRGF